MTLRNDIQLRVTKSQHMLEVISAGCTIARYACITGSCVGDKEVEGDRKTPLGHFRVVFRNPESRFFLSLGLNYPNESDAIRGLETGLLTLDQFTRLIRDLAEGDLTDPVVQDRVWKTPLGGEIFIHGCAEGRTGTAGCVALCNPDMAELFAICAVGTPVDILP